jgi:hypothetical protein
VESIAYRFQQDRQALQRFMGQMDWNHKPMVKRLVDQIALTIGEEDGILSFDPSAFEKGPLNIKLAMCRVLARTELGQKHQQEELLIVVVRPVSNGVKHDYFLTNNFNASVEELARVVVASHRVEDCFRRAKGTCGLADYEVQTWHGWNHHMTFALLACWFLTKETLRAKKRLSVADGAVGECIGCKTITPIHDSLTTRRVSLRGPATLSTKGASVLLPLLFTKHPAAKTIQ